MAKRKQLQGFRRPPPLSMRGRRAAMRQLRAAPRWGRRGRPQRFSPSADYIPLMVVPQRGWQRPKRPMGRKVRFSEHSVRIAEQDFADFGRAVRFRAPWQQRGPSRGAGAPRFSRNKKAARAQWRQRERRLRTSFKHFLREDSDVEPDMHVVVPGRVARDSKRQKCQKLQSLREKKRRVREEKDHMTFTSGDLNCTATPAKVGRCHFGRACPDLHHGCPFLHGKASLTTNTTTASRALSIEPLGQTPPRRGPNPLGGNLLEPPAQRTSKRFSLKPTKLKQYARALARLEKSAGRPLYDAKTGMFDEAALADPLLGFATISAAPPMKGGSSPAGSQELLLQAASAETITKALLVCGVVPLHVSPLGNALYRVELQNEEVRRYVLRHYHGGRHLLGQDITVIGEGPGGDCAAPTSVAPRTSPCESDTCGESDAEYAVVSDADSQADVDAAVARIGRSGQARVVSAPLTHPVPQPAPHAQVAPLPTGWERCWDDIQGRYFHINRITKTLRWEMDFATYTG